MTLGPAICLSGGTAKDGEIPREKKRPAHHQEHQGHQGVVNSASQRLSDLASPFLTTRNTKGTKTLLTQRLFIGQ